MNLGVCWVLGRRGRTANAGSNRVVRGGNWNNNASYCRSAYRNNNGPANRNHNNGFRVVVGR
jgi:formylglycine-generating enzyme required for sulfatase activity